MAAGKHGGYRDNEFRDRDPEFDVSRREFAYSKEEYDRIRNGTRAYKSRDRVRAVREDRGKVRQRDIKEREVVNGGYLAYSSRSDSDSSGGGFNRGRRLSGFSPMTVDKEPGELSSDGSEDAIESESHVKDSVVSWVAENGSRSPLEKKRKFSPIVWDRDDNEVTKSSKFRNLPSVTALPPPPPLPKAYRQSANVNSDEGVQISPIKDDKHQSLRSASPIKPHVASESVIYSGSKSPKLIASSPPKEERWSNNHQELERLEDEDYVPTRNISSSRWADGNNSPVDEGEILEDEEFPKRRKKMPSSEPLQTVAGNQSLSPELGELKRASSEGARGRSSDERVSHSRSLSVDEYPGNDSEKVEYMDIDVERDNNVSGGQSGTESEDESDSRETPEPAGPVQRSVNMLQGCRSVDEFERLNKIDEGTYGVVYRARDKKTGEIVALKKVKMEKEREGFPLTSLREINILLSFHHTSIVDVKEVVVGSNLDSIFMVMEYMEHDLKGLMETMKQPFSQSEVKCLMLQLLEGVKYLHDNWVLHRDLKTSNLLLNNRGELKICDFGLARQYGIPLKPYTHLVVTLWYRAPELLLGAKQYSTAIDMWSLGCIMAELLSKQPLFNGKTELDQLDKILRTLGTPNETIWPGFSKLPGVKVNFVKHQYNLLRKKFPATSFTGSPVLSDAGFDLLNKLLTYDPEKRITAEDALNHEWFREVPLPKSKDFMPTFPAQHAQDRRLRRIMKSPDPLEEQRRKELQQGELGTGGLFG
ncbi:Pkinase domain-containing protein [Cephalotus follicularis]|uniref:cyclin-dependent kinase n=1 Tax=Cephalotus follicularis TaxID=3775 RepID=A0A1Q3DAV5_CEPFO|nr:Pkinase domain-containing protein [Cephalotus follicularis]GAV89582.1 Pkinase domain-containing protein [Cephalotus follicularis]